MSDHKNVLAPFELVFAGLKEGKHNFKRNITLTFFEAFDFMDFIDAKLLVNIELIKKSTLLELCFKIKGVITLACDLTNELFEMSVDPKHDLVVTFGNTFNDDNEDLIVLPHGSHKLDVSQTLFETIVLAVPQKRVHPGIENGNLKSDLLDHLKRLHPSQGNKKSKEIDPRWEALKKLKKD